MKRNKEVLKKIQFEFERRGVWGKVRMNAPFFFFKPNHGYLCMY